MKERHYVLQRLHGTVESLGLGPGSVTFSIYILLSRPQCSSGKDRSNDSMLWLPYTGKQVLRSRYSDKMKGYHTRCLVIKNSRKFENLNSVRL